MLCGAGRSVTSGTEKESVFAVLVGIVFVERMRVVSEMGQECVVLQVEGGGRVAARHLAR